MTVCEDDSHICVCDDKRWHIELVIGSDVVDEVMLTVPDDVEVDEQVWQDLVDQTHAIHEQYVERAEAAVNAGLWFSIDLRCPTCQGGTLSTPKGVTSVRGSLI